MTVTTEISVGRFKHDNAVATLRRLDLDLLSYDGLAQRTLAGRIFVGGPKSKGKPRRVTHSVEVGQRENQPPGYFVSCLMLTCNRFRQAQIAVDCFRRQTFQHRELVVVDSGNDDTLLRWLNEIADPRIRIVDVRGSNEPHGTLRNLSVETASGTHVCIWDDDDLYHPCRIDAQVAVMVATSAGATMLAREVLWMSGDTRFGVLRWRSWENTLLCEKDLMPNYPAPILRGDTEAVNKLIQSQTVAYLDQPELYVRLFHGRNAWDPKHFERLWSGTWPRYKKAKAIKMLRQFSACYPIAETYHAIYGDEADLPEGLN